MALLRNIKKGHAARNEGLRFEHKLESHAAKQGITAIKIPDSCRSHRSPHGIRLIRITSPFDYVLLHKGQAIVLDTKSIAEKTFPYSAITGHQIASLSRCHQNSKASGYLIHLREIDTIIWANVQLLRQLRPRQSIQASDATIIGSSNHMDLLKLFD